MIVQILIDNPNSWIVPYAEELRTKLNLIENLEAIVIKRHEDVKEGDILCLLSCEKIFKHLHLNKYNIVVHESDLPKGKGWSPVTWQVLDGANKIPITLFEAAETVDSGVIYDQKFINLNGTELLSEIKHYQGLTTQQLIMDFINKYPDITGKPQKGVASFYQKRKPSDSEIDINKSIADQFNLLRVCDNERYPAFFYIDKKKYYLKIYGGK